MSLMHVTKDGKCAYCGAKQVLCPICNDFFYPKNRRHKICKSRCRSRKFRAAAKAKGVSEGALET